MLRKLSTLNENTTMLKLEVSLTELQSNDPK